MTPTDYRRLQRRAAEPFPARDDLRRLVVEECRRYWGHALPARPGHVSSGTRWPRRQHVRYRLCHCTTYGEAVHDERWP